MINNKKMSKAPLGLLFMSLTLLINATVAHAEVNNQSSSKQSKIETTYNESCATCHEIGALSAPKTGDKGLWNKLKTQKGMPKLVESVKNGVSQMPAGGLCSYCSDADYEALIEFMSN